MSFKLNPHVWIVPFEFISPFSLEDCATRLQSRDEPTKLISFKNPIKVKVTRLDADFFQFKMRHDVGRNLIVEAVGTLERHSDGTLVSGVSRFSRWTVLLTIVLFSVHTTLFVMVFGPIVIALSLALEAVFCFAMILGCRWLVTQLSKTLDAP
ncbi:MAG: hypothetical protein ABI947_10425 [Chloroflexota bacterium]